MIQQFVKSLDESYLINCYAIDAKDVENILKIFYDYCTEHDNPLAVALKYMIENNKRPYLFYFYSAKTYCWFPDLENKYQYITYFLNLNIFNKLKLKSYNSYSEILNDLTGALND